MRILIVGGTGMLGSDLGPELERRGWSVVSPTHSECDVTSRTALERLRKRDFGDYDWIVNCSGYTDVDGAESHAMAAMSLNAVAPGALAAVCAENGWRFLHVSTDFVFDGLKGSPYTESDPTGPAGTYGRSKLVGEQNAARECASTVIVRTSWLFGPKGKSFPRTIIDAARSGRELKVVADQWGRPTSTVHLARAIADLLALSPNGGIFHACGPDTVSWHGLATWTLEALARMTGDPVPEVRPIATSDWPTPAKRPPNSALDCSKIQSLGVAPMPPTKEALDGFVQRLFPDVQRDPCTDPAGLA